MDFPLRIHVTKILQGIYISLHSARNLFSGLRQRIFVFKIFQSPPPPPTLIKKKNGMGRPLPQIHFFFTHFEFKISAKGSSGLGGVNKVWLRILSYFNYSLS